MCFHSQHPSAKVDEDVQIGPNVVIGPDAVIEKGMSIECLKNPYDSFKKTTKKQ